MPDKYHIKTAPTPGRFRRIGKYATIDWREDCSRCSNCVKPRCLYDTYKKDSAHNVSPETGIQPLYECRACLSCVQGCTKGLLSMSLNPEYLEMGDAYWKPDIMATTWNQADTGRIPVSGAGYRGRFHGPGFDSIWTDMSEIVRPTRDGIHGREYISTAVDIGPKPMRLSFAADGKMLTPASLLIEIQLPAILDLPAWNLTGTDLARARARAAAQLKTLAVVGLDDALQMPTAERASLVPLLAAGELPKARPLLADVRMVEIVDGPEAVPAALEAKRISAKLIPALRLSLTPASSDRVALAARQGVKVFHLVADLHGQETGTDSPRHIKDALRDVHGRLVKEGIRDEITLIVGGGIALAEHMAKAIICGADLVSVETALLVALGCRMCGGAPVGMHHLERCGAEIGPDDVPYATQRIVNLMGAWHAQLIEVLGAMGIREVRRLRGEVGRAIFREDIEREAFGDLICK
jgi:hypothetical protein